jgi:hypothetical protein
MDIVENNSKDRRVKMISREKITLGFIIMTLNIILTACLQQETPAEKIYTKLEKAAVKEKEFEHVQDPLVQMEKKEKTIYDKMIELNTTQYDDKVKLSGEALKMVNERKKYMETETKSLQESEKEFQSVSPLINKISDKKVKAQANQLYELMMNRYKAHQTLSKEYLQGVEEDQKLYETFKKQYVSIDLLKTQVEKVNSIYKSIYASNDQFNRLTQQYNDKKLQFYKNAGLIKD